MPQDVDSGKRWKHGEGWDDGTWLGLGVVGNLILWSSNANGRMVILHHPILNDWLVQYLILALATLAPLIVAFRTKSPVVRTVAVAMAVVGITAASVWIKFSCCG